jgi:hypothetical protein
VGLAEADLRVHAVGPDVDVVPVGQVPILEGGVVVAPLLGQPGDGGRRQTRGAAEELLQGGDEVPGGQSVQVEQRQDLGDLRRLAAPRSQDLRGEPLPFAGGPVDASVVHAGRVDLDRAGRGDDGAGSVVAVADHQPVSTLVGLGRQLGYVLVDFRLQCGGEHTTGALSDDLVDQGAGLGGAVDGDYAEHEAYLPDPRCNAGLLGDLKDHRDGTPSAAWPPGTDPQVLSIAPWWWCRGRWSPAG